MINKTISTVDITIGSNMYGRISDLPNTPSHVLAEFVDNALQSYRDNVETLSRTNPTYRLRVDIGFEWDEITNRAIKISICDNACGIDSKSFEGALKLANTPENNQGLNEFGMGLKTAALWLGNVWCLKTTAYGESICREVTFNLNEVLENSLKELSVNSEQCEESTHFTSICISNLTDKAPLKRSISKIQDELSSIYRKSLRLNELDLYVDGEKLIFEENEILTAPSVKDPTGKKVYWKKEIDFSFGKYKAKGFVGILKDINSTKNGFVLLRRGRVVYGAETDGRYFPKALSGSMGTFRYKRIFGELELEGFSVSFNKNDLQDKENLEALMDALRGEIHTKNFDLYNQAEDYRVDLRQKHINKIVKYHNTQKKKDERVIVTTTQTAQPINTTSNNNGSSDDKVQNEGQDSQPILLGHIDDLYTINGKDYQLRVEMVDKGNDLVWLDTSKKQDNIVICKINMNHIFFQYFQNQEKAVIAILKTMALSKFTAKEIGNDSTAEMFDSFNEYIKKTKV